MSKKKGGFTIHLNKMDIVKAQLRDGYALNQKSAVMKDHTKYSRKPKHRRNYREERDAPVFFIENEYTNKYKFTNSYICN